MQANNIGLISRSSSAALSMAQQPTIFDDMNIAAGLLTEPKDPRHRSSFTGVSFVSLDGSDNPQQRADGQPDGHHEGRSRRAMRTSNTWTSSSGDVLSDQDDVDDRTVFVQEYNRLARKHGVRQVDPEEFDTFNDDTINNSAKHGSWFSRKILRKTSSSQSVKLKPERHLKHKRSISDLSIRLKTKKDKLKDKDLQELVRLCGSSLLYLPTEYAAGSLAVPTCFRATAQYLVQHAPSTRGVFRVPGSQNVVAALYNHYGSMDEDGQVVSGTVRCPTLPDHIRCDVHDVASAFKKFLSGLPGGILGSLHLFNVLISIQTQLRGDPELTRTKQSKVRARLIALAVATLRSQYRRELICAVFGLLSMIGRAAEIAPREDDRGRPLPTSDLMGYGPLGVVFGPLLVGDMLEDYTMRIANPQGGLVLLPISPPKSRKEKHKKSRTGDEGTAFNTHVDKIKVANSITEMLITHWRDVVRHMRNLSALKIVVTTKSVAVRGPRQPMLRPSASESFALRKPPDWDQFKSPLRRLERSVSPTPARRTTGHTDFQAGNPEFHHGDMLVVKKQRTKNKPLSSHRLSGGRSLSILSPTVEDKIREEQSESVTEPSTTTDRPNASGSSPCPAPPCASGSRRLASGPFKDDIYSPSSSSDDATFPPGMIPLPGPREETTDPESLGKENKNPRSAEPIAIQAVSARTEDPFEYDSQQPLHFMSTPAFSPVSPSKSSRKKVRKSKESSGSTGKSKSVKSAGSPAKLQKQSPGSVEISKSKHLKKPKENKKSENNETSEPRNYNAELSQFVADWTALDMRRKVLQIAKSSKVDMQNFKAVLDAEQATLEARYEAIKADKAASEKNLATLEAEHEAAKVENAAAGKTKVVLGLDEHHGKTFPSHCPSKVQESVSVVVTIGNAGKEDFSEADLQTLKSALETSQRERQTLEISRSELGSDWQTFSAKWAESNAGLNAADDEDAKLNAEHADLKDRVVAQDAAEDAAIIKVEAILARLSTLDESRQRHPNREKSVYNYQGTAGGTQLQDLSSTEKQDQDTLVRDASQSSKFDADQRQSVTQASSSTPDMQHTVSSTVPRVSDVVGRDPTTIRKDLGAFKADVAAWQNKWRLYKEGKQTISTPDKKLYDREKASLDARWDTLKARMDAQMESEDAEERSKSSPSLPFKHLIEKSEPLLAVPSPPKPHITISSPSSHDSGQGKPRSPRRMGGSEPGLQPRTRDPSPRRVSRSLYEDPKRKKKLLDLSRVSRDPLLRVSREEDDASLAVLARALDTNVQDEKLDNSPKWAVTETQSSQGDENQPSRPSLHRESSTTVKVVEKPLQSGKDDSKGGVDINFINKQAVSAVSKLAQIGEGIERPPSRHGERPVERPHQFEVPVSGPESADDRGDSSDLEAGKAELPTEITVTSLRMRVPIEKPAEPVRQSTFPNMPTNKSNSRDTIRAKAAGSPSKVSALVAKFNQESSPSTSPSSSPTTSPERPLMKTPTRPIPVTQVDIGPQKESVVSPYTTNPASPTKSQKSDKTPQSARTAAGGEVRSLLDPKSSPVRKQTPKRILRDSLYDSTPLRPVSRNPGSNTSRASSSPTKASNPYAVSLRSVQNNNDGSPSRISSGPSNVMQESRELDGAAIEGQTMAAPRDSGQSMRVPPPRFEINPHSKSEVPVSETSTSSSKTIRSRGTTTRIEKTTLEHHHFHLKPAGAPHIHERPSDLPAFDGPPGASNIGRVLPRPDPAPVAHHLHLPRPPPTGPGDTTEMGLTSASHDSSHPPGRSSSFLYNQVRNLQRQLSEKTDEIQHLKQQLNARGNLDMGTLSEELRETKRDLRIWKTRAEVAEKQLDILTKVPSRNNSLKHSHSTSSRRSDHQHRASVESIKEEGTMADRIRKALHGFDGAQSPRRWSSNESTETVIRDLKEVVTGSDYSMWAEQTMNAMDSADPEERIG